jgi:hypothetical protein
MRLFTKKIPFEIFFFFWLAAGRCPGQRISKKELGGTSKLIQ